MGPGPRPHSDVHSLCFSLLVTGSVTVSLFVSLSVPVPQSLLVWVSRVPDLSPDQTGVPPPARRGPRAPPAIPRGVTRTEAQQDWLKVMPAEGLREVPAGRMGSRRF